jgi:uncharacterized membrane protein YdjX (TVP38/TMEM64 family)
MEKRSTAEILLAALLLGGAVYFLFYTEAGHQWLERLKNTATDQLDKWLADLEEHLAQMEFREGDGVDAKG